MYKIIKYQREYEERLMELIRKEGDDWKIYWEKPNATAYRASYSKTITY